ncbi:MAG: tetratricopeptide repeat protein, partial [Verrucomicrobia bacterium]|nr:tetratricopeptide repeat protein [Verrucomicrobiota bacterium]
MWGWTHFLVWLCLGGALGFAAEPADDTTAKPLERVREALGRRDLEAASAEIERQLDRKPDDVEWLLIRADLVGARGRVAEALSQTRTIRERYPESRLARMKEAQWLTRLGRLNSAQGIYEALLEEAPSAEIRTLLGLTHQWRGDWQRASELFGEALRESREESLPFLGELRGLIAMGQVSRAWARARQRDVATGESDAELGLVLAGIAGGVDALDQVDALASRPVDQLDLAQAQASLRALHWARAGQLDRAIELLRSIAEAQPPHYDAYIEAADGYTAVDEQVLARRYYLHARELTPECPEAWLGLARLASREGRLTGSLALYQQVTADNPEAFEGWLGQIRMAQLLEDTTLAEAALEQAWRLAPRSALLHRERLRLALRRGDLQAFREGLRLYLRDQPGDQVAQLLNGRVRVADGEPVSTDEIRGWFDPLAPELGSQVIRLALRASGSRTAALEGLPLAPSPELINAANAKLAERLALVAEPEAALEVADRGDPDFAVWIDSLAQGWWAYLSTPVAIASQLDQDFDVQARTVWLASQIQNRLRNLSIETESPLEEDWLLTRAAWFQRWQGRWASAEAALDLARQLGGFVGSWADGVSHWELDEAWLRSEQPLPPALGSLPRRITQARWRQYRFDFTGALQAYQRLEHLY